MSVSVPKSLTASRRLPVWFTPAFLVLAATGVGVGLSLQVAHLYSWIKHCDEMDSCVEASLAGWKLLPAEVAKLETQLAHDPGDMAARETVLGYYFRYQGEPAFQAGQLRNVLWVIRNAPTSYVAGDPTGEIAATDNPSGYCAGLSAWLQMAQRHPRDSRLLDNAGRYCMVWDKSDAESLLSRGASALARRRPDHGRFARASLAARQPAAELATLP